MGRKGGGGQVSYTFSLRMICRTWGRGSKCKISYVQRPLAQKGASNIELIIISTLGGFEGLNFFIFQITASRKFSSELNKKCHRQDKTASRSSSSLGDQPLMYPTTSSSRYRARSPSPAKRPASKFNFTGYTSSTPKSGASGQSERFRPRSPQRKDPNTRVPKNMGSTQRSSHRRQRSHSRSPVPSTSRSSMARNQSPQQSRSASNRPSKTNEQSAAYPIPAESKS